MPPTILVSGRAKTVDSPHSMLRDADSVSRPGIGLSGGSGSVGMELSRISVELIELGRGVVVGTRVLSFVVVEGVRCVVTGFTGFVCSQ